MFHQISEQKMDAVHDSIVSNRADSNMTITPCPKDSGGCTTYTGRPTRVLDITAPMTNDAQSRTIRIHELIHANRTKQCRTKAINRLAIEAVEDILVHTTYWDASKMPSQANRDCLSVGLNESRIVPAITDIKTDQQFNETLLVACRSLAIISTLASHDVDRAIRKRIASRLGEDITENIVRVINLASSDKRSKAIKLLDRLMVPPKIDNRRKDNNNPDFSRKHKSDRGDCPDSTRDNMAILKLPLTDNCNSSVPKVMASRSGSRINPHRLVRAITTLSTNGLFIKRKPQLGGTVLIDASGSMGCTTERLENICKQLPSSTIAFYSSFSDTEITKKYVYGSLVIYAENGKRASKIKYRGGGNGCDFPAIQWLLKQSGPRTYIGDGQFCGGNTGDSAKANRTIGMAVANKEAKWLKSISELETSLGILPTNDE